MPGIYIADRNGTPGRGMLRGPYTATTGPIEIGENYRTFVNQPMGGGVVGTLHYLDDGIYTQSMSDCIVVCVAELTGQGWGLIYFRHIPGGYWDMSTDQEWADFCQHANKNNCYSVVIAGYETGTSVVTNQLMENFISQERMSVYCTYVNSADVAVVLRGPGWFGEVYSGGPARAAYGRYGHTGPVLYDPQLTNKLRSGAAGDLAKRDHVRPSRAPATMRTHRLAGDLAYTGAPWTPGAFPRRR
jgi:hypothetical protein